MVVRIVPFEVFAPALRLIPAKDESEESDEEIPLLPELSLTRIFATDVYLFGSGDFSGSILMDRIQKPTKRIAATNIGMMKAHFFFQQYLINSTRSISTSFNLRPSP